MPLGRIGMHANLVETHWQLLAIVVFVFPLVHVLVSKRARGMEMVGWAIVVLLFSYLGWAIYLIVTARRDHAS